MNHHNGHIANGRVIHFCSVACRDSYRASTSTQASREPEGRIA